MIGRAFAVAVLAASTNAAFSGGDPWAVTDYAVGAAMGAYRKMAEEAYGEEDCFTGVLAVTGDLISESSLFYKGKGTKNWWEETRFWLFKALYAKGIVDTSMNCWNHLQRINRGLGEEEMEMEDSAAPMGDFDVDQLLRVAKGIEKLFQKGVVGGPRVEQNEVSYTAIAFELATYAWIFAIDPMLYERGNFWYNAPRDLAFLYLTQAGIRDGISTEKYNFGRSGYTDGQNIVEMLLTVNRWLEVLDIDTINQKGRFMDTIADPALLAAAELQAEWSDEDEHESDDESEGDSDDESDADDEDDDGDDFEDVEAAMP